MKKLFLFSVVLFFCACAKPIAKFDFAQTKKVVPVEIKFSNASQNADSYHWDFGDGTTSTEKEPTHRYLLSGNYEVILTAIKGGKKIVGKKSLSLMPPKDCLVNMETTAGHMLFSLSDETPKHRDNFIKLADDDYYVNLLFHRVIKGFMAQGGDPTSRNAKKGTRLGTGGPSYTIDAEITPKNVHVKGALATARQPDNANPKKKSNGSQFYIVHGKEVSDRTLEQMELRKGFEYSEETKLKYKKVGGTPFLDMDYTVFGQLVEGWEVLENIASSKTDPADRQNEDILIKKVTVIK